MTPDPSYWTELLRGRFHGQRVVLAYGVVASLGPEVERLRALGAPPPFALVEGIGTGDMPVEGTVLWHVMPEALAGADPEIGLMSGIRAHERWLAALPEDTRAALDRWDPDRSAIVIRQIFGTLHAVAGRRVWGPRAPAWVALEDKTTVDAFWDRAGIERAPARVVAPQADALHAAAAELDEGAGTVWAGDARHGWHGGATHVLRVEDEASERLAAEFLARRCNLVRVMPFLEGIPCSIHGIVIGDSVVVLRPVEQVTLRHPPPRSFHYGGCATYWDPREEDREAMRRVARRTGEALRAEVGFRGTFTVDGIMTARGFLPTELNPRFGAGIHTIAKAIPELPLFLLDQAICAGEPWDFRPQELEALLLATADACRTGGVAGWSTLRSETTTKLDLVEEAGAYRRAQPGEIADATLMIGPSSTGSFVRVTLDAARNASGWSIGPKAVEALAFADRELGTGFGPLTPARDVRRVDLPTHESEP